MGPDRALNRRPGWIPVPCLGLLPQMLQRRPISWKAVGLTAAIVRCALTPSSRRKAPRRVEQRGVEQQVRERPSGKQEGHPGSESQRRQEKAEAEAGDPRARHPGAIYPVEEAGKRATLPGKSQGCGAYHPGRVENLFGAEPNTSPVGMDDVPRLSTDGGRQPVPLETLLLDQEAWGRYLRMTGTGEKGEPKEGGKVNPSGPPKERGKEEKERPGPGDREGDERDKLGEGGGGPDKKSKGNTTLKYGPVCCSCPKNGVHDIGHTTPLSTRTFVTRPIRPNSSTGIGLCLMPSSRGSIRLSEGPVCGHTPCPDFTVVKQDRTMCKCCADRIEAHGAGVGGAGPLPPLQLEEAEDAREARSNSMDSRAGPSREGRGRVRSPSPPPRVRRKAASSPSPQPERRRRREEGPPRERKANPSSGRADRAKDEEEYEIWCRKRHPRGEDAKTAEGTPEATSQCAV